MLRSRSRLSGSGSVKSVWMEEKAVSDYTLRYVGDQALLVEFENEISMEVNQKVRALKFDLEQKKSPVWGSWSPPTGLCWSTMTP